MVETPRPELVAQKIPQLAFHVLRDPILLIADEVIE
jgi:hypothetical protein